MDLQNCKSPRDNSLCGVQVMKRIIVLIASAVINASTIPAVAAECTNRDIDASRTPWATLRSQPANAADSEKTCRAYAAAFYESVTLRQAAAGCVDRER